MRSNFQGFYSPTADAYQALWNEGLIVLDTNVLLDLYRLPEETRQQFLDILEVFKNRVWIPHHVGLEFQVGRLAVIDQRRKRTKSVLDKAQGTVDELERQVADLDLAKSGLNIQPDELMSALKKANERIIAAVEQVHSGLATPSQADPIREEIDRIVGSDVGPPPADQDQLDLMLEDAEERYDLQIPPGYLDSGKSDGPNGGRFTFDGLTYQSQYGDLVIWKQILERAQQEPKPAGILLVTAEKKKDWWWTNNGGDRLGPRPELRHEMSRRGGMDLFWMYSTDQFAKHAAAHTNQQLSEQSVVDLATISPSGSARYSRVGRGYRSLESLRKWLLVNEFGTSVDDGTFGSFPDLRIIHHSYDDVTGPEHGVELLATSRLDDPRIGNRMLEAARRGYIEISEGRLSGLTIVVVFWLHDSDPTSDVRGVDGLNPSVRRRMMRWIERIEDEISTELGFVVGRVENENFQPLFEWGRPYGL